MPIVSAAEKIDNNFDKEIIARSQLPMVLSEGDTQREIEMIDTLAQKYYYKKSYNAYYSKAYDEENKSSPRARSSADRPVKRK